ncbi:Ribosome biogenesis protein YTM1 [Madurella mycetomatis]|uniref:Ribosome biogenesis protein YTM1 n=1 Tax=Madurella mycetomatis TaxID=100816 RepID=A0A175VNU1_9PEZI|nr:Ribosome biogenesis protein YTM1 [Madurella mycetomatis]KXX78105.1 Ribosome biogenesis protein YTM1 [Madurella mycetomatis]
MDEPMADTPTAQVKVTFTTTEADLQLPESKRQLLVPADIHRYGLSRILNSESMLDTGSIPFDFLVNGSFLRSSLEDYLTSNGLSLETNLSLQYVRSLIPPVYEASFEHDDWVSAVDVLSESSPSGRWSGDSFQRGQDRILSASYDGLLRIWNPSGQVITTSPSGSHGGHTASIKAAKFLSNSQLASAGMDRTVRVWRYTETNDFTSGELKPTLELYGHTGSIDSLEVDGASKRILTASADGVVGFWSTSKSSSPEADASLLPGAHTSKRRKVNPSISTAQRGPLSLMQVHSAPASAAVFDPRDRTVAYSASQDHTVRTLDLTTGAVVSTLPTSHPLLSLCAIPRAASAPLLAAGTAARHITLVDPRASASTTSVMTLRGHTNKVVSMSAAPDNEYSLVSGSHDGTCRIWDLRSVRPATKDEGGLGSVSEPVYVIERESRQGKKKAVAGEGCKVFSLVWDKLGIFSGGEDKKIQINRGRDVVAQ